jgi:nicotinamidase-related amidase
MANNNPLLLDCLNLTICGIAGDYCVKNTIDKLINSNCSSEFNIKVMLNGIASIDDGTTIKKFIEDNNLTIV